MTGAQQTYNSLAPDQVASAEELARQSLYAFLTCVLAKPMTLAEGPSTASLVGSASPSGAAATALHAAILAPQPAQVS